MVTKVFMLVRDGGAGLVGSIIPNIIEGGCGEVGGISYLGVYCFACNWAEEAALFFSVVAGDTCLIKVGY